MSDTKVRAPRATEILVADHERVKTLFSEYEEFGDDSALTKEGIYEEILRQLAIHGKIEEEIFYPAILDLGNWHDAGGAVEDALEEHRIVKALLAELSMFAPDSQEFDATMQALEDSVDRHVQEEEKELFPLFEKLDAAKRDEVSEALWHRKAELSEGSIEGEHGSA
jgi:iron-sulfur cluster repair protein YtfE (RIC family)